MPGRQISGFAIVRKPAPLVASYDSSMAAHQAKDVFQDLCKVLYPLPRAAYGGISRDPLKALPSEDPQMLRAIDALKGVMVYARKTAPKVEPVKK